jgi:hypothetical protein
MSLDDDCSRPECANSGRSLAVLRMAHIDRGRSFLLVAEARLVVLIGSPQERRFGRAFVLARRRRWAAVSELRRFETILVTDVVGYSRPAGAEG